MVRVMSFVCNILGNRSLEGLVIRKTKEKIIIGVITKPGATFFHDEYGWNYLPAFQEYLNRPLKQIEEEDKKFVKALRKGTVEEIIITHPKKRDPYVSGYDVSIVKNIGQSDEFAQHIADFLN